MKGVVIGESDKDIFRKPFGNIFEKTGDAINAFNNAEMVISVGDTISHALIENNYYPDIIIIDGMAKRKKFEKRIEYGSNVIEADNPRGSITPSLCKAVLRAIAIRNDVKVVVKGEEDLAVLPAVIFAPENSIIAYGQPDDGIVIVKATGEKKREAVKILEMVSKSHGEM